jgi:hypothetical protein
MTPTVLKAVLFQVYMVSPQPGPRLPELLFLSVIANLSKVAFSTTIGKIVVGVQ